MRISKNPQVRKEEIIKIAEELFLAQGIEKTSIAQIARSVGVAKGLVYYYFNTKEEVLEGVIKDIAMQQVAFLKEHLALESTTFFERLLILIDAYYNIYPCKIAGISNIFQLEHQLIFLFHRQFVAECGEIYAEIILEGRKQGYLMGVYPEETLIMTLEGVFGLSNLRQVSKEQIALLVEQALDLPDNSLVAISNRLLNED